MAILYNEYVHKGGELADLATVRKSIVAAAKRAAKAGRRDRIEVVIPAGKHVVTEPFKLSAKETPELDSLDITIRAALPGASEVSSLVRMDGTKFVKAEDHDYFTYDFIKEEGKAPLFRDFFLNFKKLPVARSRNFLCIDFDDKQCVHGYKNDVLSFTEVCKRWDIPYCIEKCGI